MNEITEYSPVDSRQIPRNKGEKESVAKHQFDMLH